MRMYNMDKPSEKLRLNKKITRKYEKEQVHDECAASMAKSDAISIEALQESMIINLKNAMSEIIGDIVIDREKELKSEFENKLESKLDEMRSNLTEDVTNSIKKQVHAENQKLMLYLSSLREENRRGFFSKIFRDK